MNVFEIAVVIERALYALSCGVIDLKLPALLSGTLPPPPPPDQLARFRMRWQPLIVALSRADTDLRQRVLKGVMMVDQLAKASTTELAPTNQQVRAQQLRSQALAAAIRSESIAAPSGDVPMLDVADVLGHEKVY